MHLLVVSIHHLIHCTIRPHPELLQKGVLVDVPVAAVVHAGPHGLRFFGDGRLQLPQ